MSIVIHSFSLLKITYILITCWSFCLVLGAFLMNGFIGLTVTFLHILIDLLSARCTLCLRMTAISYQNIFRFCLNRWLHAYKFRCSLPFVRIRTSSLNSTSKLQRFSFLNKAFLDLLFILIIFLILLSPWVPVYLCFLDTQLLSISNI